MATPSQQKKNWGFTALKLIGIGLFLWILSRLDRETLLMFVGRINTRTCVVILILIMALYGVKTLRWHLLVHRLGARPTLATSWRLYNIGVFLSTITPAKIGEVGRAAYLLRDGMDSREAIMLAVIDRLMDGVVIAVVTALGMGALFGWKLGAMSLTVIGVSFLCGGVLWKRHLMHHPNRWLVALQKIMDARTVILALLYTTLSWCIYFVLAVLLARSVGIAAPLTVLIASFTVAGIITLLPIAPSGLGTRDAALIALLLPYGVPAEQSVALGFLMFVTILVSSIPGLYYWGRGHPGPHPLSVP